MRRSVMNYLAPAGFALSIAALLLTLLSAFCISGLFLNPVVGAIAGIVALVASAVGLTLTGVARTEIVQNAQYGDGFAVSGMAVGVVACACSVAALILYFIFYA